MEPLTFFQAVREKVPAYADFCRFRGTAQQPPWQDVPLLDKQGYLLRFPMASLCWNGSLADIHLLGASSGFGKSGALLWPKRPADEQQYLEAVEAMLRTHYQIEQKKTLVLVSLAFGLWIGGMQIAAAIRTLAGQGRYGIVCATPGLNLAEAVEVFAQLAEHVDQTLIITNPSNINIFLALFRQRQLPVDRGSISFPVVGEYFSEGLRQRVARAFGHEQDAPFCVWTGYGSADTGDIGMETEPVIRLRQYLFSRPELSSRIFGTTDTPMLFETTPKAFVEIIGEDIVVTKDQLIPLVRYNTRDRGGLLTRAGLQGMIPEQLLPALPEQLLYVHGRSDDSIVFYGTNLRVGDINDFFLSLDAAYGYGGLFQVAMAEEDGVALFRFTVFTDQYRNEELADRYRQALLGYLLAGSHEFKIKYDHLSAVVGARLLQVSLGDIKSLQGNLKHKFILEDAK
jgi:phenylacetate-CoA ligase